MNIKHILGATVLASFVFGCGGGDKSSSNDQSIKGNLKGDWQTECLSNGNDSIIVYASHDLIDGSALYGEGTELYSTSDCSGSVTTSWKLVGPVSYGGTVSTSICSAQKFDATFSLIEIDGVSYDGEKFDRVMSQLSALQRNRSSLACIYRDNYLEGTRSDGARPDEVNTIFVFYRQ